MTGPEQAALNYGDNVALALVLGVGVVMGGLYLFALWVEGQETMTSVKKPEDLHVQAAKASRRARDLLARPAGRR